VQQTHDSKLLGDNYGYVQVDIDSKSKLLLHRTVTKCVKPTQYYNSKQISYIKGDVTSEAHMTVCYGIKNSDLHERYAKSKISIQTDKELTIYKVDYWLGAQNEYCLIYAVPEDNSKFYKLDNWIRNNNEIYEKSLAFEPHISLCYIRNIPIKTMESVIAKISKSLIGKKIMSEEISFFKPITEVKIKLKTSLDREV